MKKIYKNLTLPALALLMAGCEDILDTAPMGSTITADQKEEVVASDPTRIEASVSAITANFLQFGGIYTDESVHSDIGYPCIMLATESRGTDMVADAVGYNWFSISLVYEDAIATSYVNTLMWNTLFNQIYTVNNLMSLIDPATEDPQMQYYLAQGYAIRAFDYFTGIQLYQANYKGHEDAMGMPLITETNREEVALNGCARSTVQETYDFILEDLNKAIELLANCGVSRTDKRYVSLDVAYGIRARVYLAMHNYEAALADAQTALSLTGSTPYSMSDVSRPSFINIDDNSWMWGILVTEQDRCSTSGICNFPSHMGSLNYGYASVGGWRRISKPLYDQIPDTDVRKGWFLDANGQSVNLPTAAQSYITSAKAPAYTQVKYGVLNDEWGTDNNATDVILMRAEEMYLIMAEAQAMSGDVAGGISTLNAFVQTYRDPSYACTATTGEDVQEAVWQQRRIEFWGEGMAYFDIMRLNKGVNRLGCGFPAEAVFNIPAGDNLLVYPIPYNEVQYNPLLQNNPANSIPTPIADPSAAGDDEGE